jgi:hypothetical protein
VTRIDADPATVADIFSEFYVIPVFQREYIWKPRHVKVLLTDLHVAHTTGSSEDYFLGSLITYREDGCRHVVDGQQRLTTLYLMLAILRDRLTRFNGDKGTVLVLENALRGVAVARQGSQTRYRIEHTIPELSRIISAVASGKGHELTRPSTREASYDLVRAYELCSDFLEDTFGTDTDKLQAFFSFLWNDVELVDVKADDMQQAFTIFETINFRGVTLNATDLMKNLLFREADPNGRSYLTGRWRELLSTLRKGKESHPVRFLRYFAVTKHGFDRMPTASELFSTINQPEVAASLGYQRDPAGFVDEMVEAAEAYSNINTGCAPSGQYEPYVEGIALQGSGVRQHLCLLLAGRHLPTDQFARLAARIEALVLVYAVVGIQWNKLEALLPQWAPRISGILNEGDLDTFLQSEIEPLLAKNASTFFSQLYRTDLVKPRILRYILASLTQHLEIAAGKDVELNEILKPRVTVEHILSQKPTSDAIDEFGPDANTDLNEYVYALGNLMLLHLGPNATASNAAFSLKRETYEKAAVFDLSRAVFKDIAYGKRSATSRALKQFGLSPSETWCPDDLWKRHESLLEMVADVWELPRH